jgi:hypothetical protein
MTLTVLYFSHTRSDLRRRIEAIDPPKRRFIV